MTAAADDQAPPATTGARWRLAGIACFWLLFALLCIRATFSVQATEASPWLIYGVTLLPLLAFAAVVHKASKKGLAWLAFLLCVYFLQPVIDLMVLRNVWLNSALTAVIVALFICIMGIIRFYTRRE